MKKNNISAISLSALAALTLTLSSCSLDEENPGGSTMENFATSVEGMSRSSTSATSALRDSCTEQKTT